MSLFFWFSWLLTLACWKIDSHIYLLYFQNTDAVQFFLLPVVLGSSFFALVVGNTLYAAALSWYWYVTHLGYRTLPFLSNTEVFLFPIAAIAVVYVLNLVLHPLGFSWNTSIMMARFYFGSYLTEWKKSLEAWKGTQQKQQYLGRALCNKSNKQNTYFSKRLHDNVLNPQGFLL